MINKATSNPLTGKKDKITKEELKEIIKTGDRKRVGRTVLAKGLLLKKVEY